MSLFLPQDSLVSEPNSDLNLRAKASKAQDSLQIKYMPPLSVLGTLPLHGHPLGFQGRPEETVTLALSLQRMRNLG